MSGPVPPPAGASGITSLTGDVTGTGPGATATTLANIPAISGANLTTLNGTNISSGTVANARLNIGTSGATIPLLNGANTWSAAQTISGGNALTLSGGSNTSSIVMSNTFPTITAASLVLNTGGDTTTGYFRVAPTLFWIGAGALNIFVAQSDGVLTLQNGAQTSYGRLQFGGTTSSFPSIKRSSATLAFRLADDSADASITAAAITSSGAVTVGSGQTFKIGNAATTGLAAGVLAATTNATIVITDSAGQAYRVPCII